MESPSGIVKALYHICANRNAKCFKLIHLDFTNYPYVLLVKKTPKIPIFNSRNCRVADHGAEIISAMILYENSTYPQRGKQPSRPKPQTS